ncbi:hypothetical protein EVJ58_g6657 [Rhodofomes roseus]|uniref:Fungal-type protein kinase domain-containing protein n=1 Tax=Rhodofomes roseus TaxID=34475 RepID=A0A4Y9Y822_9APHY|nr:hypothetical protein EVJ58_g6657 [Rhodofomes roseus]
MKDNQVAQVSVADFMREFVPGPDLPDGFVAEPFLPANFRRQEAAMYGELCKVANSVLSQGPADQMLVAKDTHRWCDPLDKYDFEDKLSPDVIIYPSHADARRAYTLEDLSSFSDEERKRHENKARTSWLWATLYIEAKADEKYTPFSIPDSMRELETQKEEETQRVAPQTSTQEAAQKTQKQKSTGSAGALSLTTDSLICNMQVSATRSQESFAAPSLSAPVSAGPSTAATPSVPSITHVPTADTPGSRDEVPPFLLQQSSDRLETMEQMSHYVSKVMQRQFLLHFFTIFTCRDVAWLLRWDRAGLVVSEPFILVKNPRLLHTFLYRFARMSDTDRGHDPSVVPATEAEAQLLRSFNKFPPPETWCRETFAGTLVDGWPISKILVPEDDMISEAELMSGTKEERGASEAPGRRMCEFLVGKPTFMNTSVYGRATRCHIAYDVAGDRLVFCKECWRTDTPTSHPEGEVYLRLHSKNVSYIATPIAAGDVHGKNGAHRTRTQEFTKGSNPMLIQYRLILEEIARPLTSYKTSSELITALYLCLRAHEEAWRLAKIIHQDISAGNMLIYWYRTSDGELVWKALLVDWGLCKYEEEMNDPVVRRTRAGTWQFISAVLLRWPTKFMHTIFNDLESFIHVLHWMCLRFHATNMSESQLIAHVRWTYDDIEKDASGNFVGGYQKFLNLFYGSTSFRLLGGSANAGLQSPGLQRLLRELARLCQQHYRWMEPQLPVPDSVLALLQKSQDNPPPAARRKDGHLPPPKTLRRTRQVAQNVSPEPVLETHTAMMEAFEVMLYSPLPWVEDDKVGDRFACAETFLEQQQRQSREASRLSSEMESLAEDRPRKRRVGSSTSSVTTSATESATSESQLGSINENIES